MKKYCTLLIGILFLAACTAPVSITPQPSDSKPLIISTDTTIPPHTIPPTSTLPPLPTHTSTPLPSPTPYRPILPQPEIHDEAGPIYDTVIQIPISEEGIQYRGAGVEDMEPVGPNGIVVTQDGTIVIGDVNDNRLLRFDSTGKRLDDIDLTALDILDISDLVGANNMLYILEISFKVLPERYRVNQLTSDGQLVSQYDLPKGYHFEDGLFGLAIGYSSDGNPIALIQFNNADNSQYFKIPDSPDAMPEKLPSFPVFGNDLMIQSGNVGELAVLRIGAQEFESQVTVGGTILLLSARADGSLYLERDDLVSWEPITTDITIHYVSPDGKLLGIARYPLMDWYFHVWRFLTVGPDGNVYGLITRENSVDILRLNFYKNLQTIAPGVAEPVVTRVTPGLTPGLTYDCSSILHYQPDSTEAQQIVQSFLTNFEQDFPTEYMAFEQLWSVDRLGEYAVIQGMVTQEESDIIATQETDRGFVMAARYISNMILPGFQHLDIPGYLTSQVPDAPPELFHCLDLSRFVGDR